MLLNVVLKKTLENPLDYKEIKPVSPKVNQLWIFIERTDAETETTILWPRVVKSRLIRKDPDAGKVWRLGGEGDDMMRWLDGITNSMHEFEQAPGDGEGQGNLACCSPWCCKESDMTEWPNNKATHIMMFSYGGPRWLMYNT